MALNKKSEFPETQTRLADLAKALSHPARLAILNLLAARETCICGELVGELPLAQATVSQHLKALKASGLVQGNVEGPRSCYCIDWKAVLEAKRMFADLFQELELGNKNTCC